MNKVIFYTLRKQIHFYTASVFILAELCDIKTCFFSENSLLNKTSWLGCSFRCDQIHKMVASVVKLLNDGMHGFVTVILVKFSNYLNQ
jgi:hypothetical protein